MLCLCSTLLIGPYIYMCRNSQNLVRLPDIDMRWQIIWSRHIWRSFDILKELHSIPLKCHICSKLKCAKLLHFYVLHFFSITHINVMSSFKFFFSLQNIMDTQMNSKFCHSFFALLKCCTNCLSNRCMWSYTSKPAWPACHWLIWRYLRGTPLSFVSKIYSTVSMLGMKRTAETESRGIMQVPG